MHYDNVLELVGKTPLVKLNRVTKGVEATVLAKMESLNPGGSVKDRIGINMIEQAEKEGKLKPGGTIIEGTSGNTGVGLAIVAAIKGYKCIFTMPDKMSQEKVNLLRAYGAEVIVTPTAVEPEDPRSYYSVARRLNETIPNSYYPNQYANPANPETHYRTTGPELWEQTEGKIDVFVCGLGTGGTISGTGKYLKEKNPKIRIVGVDPAGSLYTEFFKEKRMPANPCFKTYKVEGIGEDFMPTTIDFDVIDEVITVGDKESFLMARKLCREEGIFAGGSTGTALVAALQVARKMKKGETLVMLVPDSGSRYLSTFYRDDWMRQHEFLDVRVHLKAQDVLAGKRKRIPLMAAHSTDKVTVLIERLKKMDFSQVPVIDEGEVVGSVREEQLIDVLLNNPKPHDLIVGEIMSSPLRVVDEETPLEDLYKLLSAGQAAVLVKGADGLDIVTKFDLLRVISEAEKEQVEA